MRNSSTGMKIGFFTDSYLPITHGVEVSIETSRKILEKMGHQVYIYAPKSPGYRDKNPNVFRFKSSRVIKKPEMRYAFIFLPVGRRFKEISRFKLDIVHAHTPFGMGILAKYISERQLIPLIYTHHTHYQEYAKFYLKEEILLPYLAKIYTTWFCNLSDAVIAPSLKVRKFLRSYGVKKNIPIHILPTGIDLNVFRKSLKNRCQLRKKLKISPKTKVLLSIGRIGREKNVEFLIKSVAMLFKKKDDVLLLMVGDGPFLKQLKKLVQKLKIKKSVIFTGKVPHKEISSYYQAADIFLFASLTDTQGIVILEALSSGLPVVALDDDAFNETIVNKKNGFLIKTQSPKQFSAKIGELLDNPSLYKKFSDSAKEEIGGFSEKNMAGKLVEIYKEQIEKGYQ